MEKKMFSTEVGKVIISSCIICSANARKYFEKILQKLTFMKYFEKVAAEFLSVVLDKVCL